MNPYFRSIGFSDIADPHELQPLIKAIAETPDKKYIVGKNDRDIFVEYYKAFGDHFGMSLRGRIDDKENVTIDTCNPYSFSHANLGCSHVDIEHDGEHYLAVAQDAQSGNELIFHLQNVLDYLNEPFDIVSVREVNVVGLSLNGTVILPVRRDEEAEKVREEENAFYRDLAQRARDGDKDAQVLLDFQEFETTETMRERLQKEDFLSVVEGFFMPLEEDDTCYSILGNIEASATLYNRHTNESIYKLLLNITGTRFELCINASDLVGVPIEGMRFMGSCWLQGKLIFDR